MKISVLKYLRKYDIDIERIANRYIQILKMFHEFLEKQDLGDSVIINGRILKRTVIDYFIDIVRIKEFHNINNTNNEKIYAYTAYWLLRRKPLQVIKPFNGCEFVNELFITFFLISSSCETRNIDNDKKNKNPALEGFQSFLFYNLKYRSVSQQSLELMIEAFFCGYDFPKGQR
jgi:hypothetical protein